MEQGKTRENSMPRRRTENRMAAPPTQKCPRCNSSNTKFCYYNNYSLSQPRYFCKACRRYWTHGGTLRNVPVGGGCRKSKRPKPSPSSDPEIAGSQPFSAALGVVPPHQNLTAGVSSGRALRAPIMGSSNYVYTGGGAFLSSLATVHNSLPAGINIQGQYDANVALLQNFQPMKQNDQIFQSQQSLNNINPAGPGLGSWTQSFISGSASSWAAPTSNVWTRDVQARSNYFDPNQCPDNNSNNNNSN